MCVSFFPLALFTRCVNETLDVAKPIHLNPIVQTPASEDRASGLPGNSGGTCSPVWTRSMRWFNWERGREGEGEGEEDKEMDLIGRNEGIDGQNEGGCSDFMN